MGVVNSEDNLDGDKHGSTSSLQQSVLSHFRWQHMVAGVSGGVISTLVLHPLDLIKIRFQGKLVSLSLQIFINFCTTILCYSYPGLDVSFLRIGVKPVAK